MDATDLTLFKSKKKEKLDKADATYFHEGAANKEQNLVQPEDSWVVIPEKGIIISRPTDEDEYNCNNPYAGIALIFNHKDVRGNIRRLGTEQDRDAMEKTLQNYGYDVRVYNDLKVNELTDVLQKTAQEDHTNNDCIIVVVMSHGMEGKVYARDLPYPVERLWNPFLGENCKSLINKPKLFFIQACRGENVEKAVQYYRKPSASLEVQANLEWEKTRTITYAIPNTADLLVMYSTFEKHCSFRNIENGSWFIQSLCSVLDEASVTVAMSERGAELLRLLTAVNRKVAYEYQSNSKYEALHQMKEMPNFLSTLTKTFYLKVKRNNNADATYSHGATANKEQNPLQPEDGSLSIPEKKIIVSRPTDEDEYDCNNPYAGIALVFNHKDVKGQKQRVGTEQDRDAMEKTLKNYGYDVRVYNDLTFAELTDVLKKTAQEDHTNNDCIIVAVMSHGMEGKVYARDLPYPVERLWNPFLGENCKSLINKPKLFFIQACRGENLEKAVQYTTTFAPMSRELNVSAEPEKPPTITYAIPNTADMLVMYSTFEKYYSFRNVENGSWFIQSLCSVLDEASVTVAMSERGAELLRLLTAVNRKVAYEYQSNAKYEALNQMKEMPNFLSTLTKTFYLKVKRTNSNNNNNNNVNN
ncbi:hypothetical protein DOY81_003040 [Sarcophaga bullata]|nr:hypothetical protein DOY81_003040 [Sarcophaga bullata]